MEVWRVFGFIIVFNSGVYLGSDKGEQQLARNFPVGPPTAQGRSVLSLVC